MAPVAGFASQKPSFVRCCHSDSHRLDLACWYGVEAGPVWIFQRIWMLLVAGDFPDILRRVAGSIHRVAHRICGRFPANPETV